MLKLFLVSSILASPLLEASSIKSTGENPLSMDYTLEKQQKKHFIGIEIRTNNQECIPAMRGLWEKFYKEGLLEKIPHKVNSTIYALYTKYEGDFTKPYSYILGCEVSSLEEIPEGFIWQTVPAASYAVYTTKGQYPQGLTAAWHAIWKSTFKRAYTTDFEVYRTDFNPQTNPEVKVYIAL
jgi:predicted transcriptional regulator YdeE